MHDKISCSTNAEDALAFQNGSETHLKVIHTIWVLKQWIWGPVSTETRVTGFQSERSCDRSGTSLKDYFIIVNKQVSQLTAFAVWVIPAVKRPFNNSHKSCSSSKCNFKSGGYIMHRLELVAIIITILWKSDCRTKAIGLMYVTHNYLWRIWYDLIVHR